MELKRRDGRALARARVDYSAREQQAVVGGSRARSGRRDRDCGRGYAR